jgi:hypothetical protein
MRVSLPPCNVTAAQRCSLLNVDQGKCPLIEYFFIIIDDNQKKTPSYKKIMSNPKND